MISGLTDFHGQIKDINLISAAQNKCMFNSIFQLSNIAGPIIVHDNTHGILGDVLDCRSCLLIEMSDKVIDQQWNIFFSSSQRRKMDGKNLETVIEVIPEMSPTDEIVKILLACGDNPYIDSASFGFSNPLYLPFLQHAQEFHLNKGADLTDFIQKDGAAIGLLEASRPITMGPGKCPSYMAEQFTFKQRF